MSTYKRQPMTQSSVLLGGLHSLENKENLNGDQVKEMIELLKAYETLCIQREDFSGADSVKNKIEHLKGQQILQRKETIAFRQKQQIQVICKEGEQQIKQFQTSWDLQINNLIEQLKRNEEQLVRIQQTEMDQFIDKLAKEDVPRVKYSSLILEKRKYLSNLIKTRNYKEAELIKNTLKEMEASEDLKWAQKMEERRQIRIQKMQKKQAAELQAFRIKLEGIFNQKIKERDRKFQILLKKNRKRRIQSSKPSRERIQSRNGILGQRMSQSRADRSLYSKIQ